MTPRRLVERQMIRPTPEEIAVDEKHEAHLNWECGDDCPWCDEIDQMAKYTDAQLRTQQEVDNDSGYEPDDPKHPRFWR